MKKQKPGGYSAGLADKQGVLDLEINKSDSKPGNQSGNKSGEQNEQCKRQGGAENPHKVCKNCEFRHAYCHVSCEVYADMRKRKRTAQDKQKA